MGCGESKPITFEGTPDEEIQHHAKSIHLAAQSGEGGKGPENRINIALKGVASICVGDEVKINPSSADKFAASIEVLRLEANSIYQRYLSQINAARIAIMPKISFTDLNEEESVIQKVNYSKLKWIPRVVNCDPSSLNYLGSSVEFGLTGSGAASLGFCIEAWVYTDQPKKSGEYPPLFSLLHLLDGPERLPGMDPTFTVDCDGRPTLDFHKHPCSATKGKAVENGEWSHVAVSFGQEVMKVYLNGVQVGAKSSPPPWGEVAVAIAGGQTGFITEMRVWACDRTPQDIKETMNVSICPQNSKDYPGLRLCWLPLKLGGGIRPEGALLYDLWRKRSVGVRTGGGPIADCRWPCALPAALIPSEAYTYAPIHLSDHAEDWEQHQLDYDANHEVPKKYSPALSVVETRALQIVSVMMCEGGPWIPRVVCLPPGTSACVGTTRELGLTDGATFTVEAWVRIRGLQSDRDSCILGIGAGDPVSPDKAMRLVLRRGRPRFVLAGKFVESEVGLSRMRWTHLAFVWDGKSQMIYANGTLLAAEKTGEAILSGSSVITVGSSHGKEDFTGDLCELRVWNRALNATDVEAYMKIAIPPLGGKGHRSLRLTWLPLRNGGPVSQETWMRRKLLAGKLEKPLSHSSNKHLRSPLPTLLWDVAQGRDIGKFTHHPAGLLTSRTRNLHIPVFIPEDSELPPYWSKSALGLVDDWSDCYDRAFVPKWYVAPTVDENDHEAFAQFPTNAGEAVTKGGTWVGRVMRTKQGCNYSVAVGATAELGLLGVGTGGREMTLECWIRTREYDIDKKKIFYEDILGHEEESSTQTTGFFFKETYALRVGLANGHPFISLQGTLKSMKSSDNKDAVIAPDPIEPKKWTHLAFLCVGDGRILIFVNGEEVAKKDKMNCLQAKGDTMIHAFGYDDRLLKSDICEMRLWSTARSKDDIKEGMGKSYAPLPSGLARVPDLRLAWFPCNSSRSVFWDHKYIMYRAVFKRQGDSQLPRYSRRPNFLPPKIRAGVTALPPAYILDDNGDAFERNLSPLMLPPVVRKDDGTVDYTHYDPDFVPLKKDHNHDFASAPSRRETIDLGWLDSDDGALLSLESIHLDDGGWMDEWDPGDVESICEEVVDLSKFVPPAESSLPCSRRPSATLDVTNVAESVESLCAAEDELNSVRSGDHGETKEQTAECVENPGDAIDTPPVPEGAGVESENPGDVTDNPPVPEGAGVDSENPGDATDPPVPEGAAVESEKPGDATDTTPVPEPPVTDEPCEGVSATSEERTTVAKSN